MAAGGPSCRRPGVGGRKRCVCVCRTLAQVMSPAQSQAQFCVCGLLYTCVLSTGFAVVVSNRWGVGQTCGPNVLQAQFWADTWVRTGSVCVARDNVSVWYCWLTTAPAAKQQAVSNRWSFEQWWQTPVFFFVEGNVLSLLYVYWWYSEQVTAFSFSF